MRHRHALVASGLLFVASPAFANMVWPALYLETRLFSWWAISVGLLIEAVAIQRMFQLQWSRAVLADVAANAGSALLGVPLIPIAGIVWELFPGSVYMSILKWGTFNPVTWAATFFLACAVNAVVEALVLKRFLRLPTGRKQFAVLLAANGLSVGVAFASLFVVPIEP